MGDPWTIPLDQIDVSDARLFQDDVWPDWFARLRRDDPVHYTADSQFGPYWSVTKYKDIMKVETNPQVFSSASGITLLDQETQYRLAMFIAMDPPKHDVQRLVVAPIVAPGNLATMAGTIRERAIKILDGLPRKETFDWVEHVSVELTTQMLATLFDYPFEQRRDLTYWSNIATTNFKDPNALVKTEEERFTELQQDGRGDDGAVERAGEHAWRQRPDLDAGAWRGDAEHGPDGVHGELRAADRGRQRHDAQLDQRRVVGAEQASGRVSQAAGKSRADPDHGAGDHSLADADLPICGGRRWRIMSLAARRSGRATSWRCGISRATAMPRRSRTPDRFIIDRARPRQHLSFGFGIHRCVGNRLAELQLTILWEEIMKRFPVIELVEEPKRVFSSFVHGISSMMVRIPA